VLVVEAEAVDEPHEEGVGHPLVVEKPAREAPVALLQALADLLDEVARELVLHLEVGVAGELDAVALADLARGEERREAVADDVVEKEHHALAPGLARPG